MGLSKKQREALRNRYGGLCAYCGNPLGEKWHADHREAVQREGRWVRDGYRWRYEQTGVLGKPENDRPDNYEPACVPCNIDKSDLPLETWRTRLINLQRVMRDNHSAYRHALRFGLIVETPPSIKFLFERYTKTRTRVKLLE